MQASELDQLRRFIRQVDGLNRKGKLNLLEIIDHYERTISSERLQEPKTSDEHPGVEVKPGTSNRSRRKKRQR